MGVTRSSRASGYAEGRPRVAAAEGLQLAEGLDALHTQQRGVVDAQVADQAGRLGGRQTPVVFPERRAKALDLVAPYREARGERVTAEALEPVGAGGQRVKEVEAAETPQEPLPLSPSRHIMMAGRENSSASLEAAMPMTP